MGMGATFVRAKLGGRELMHVCVGGWVERSKKYACCTATNRIQAGIGNKTRNTIFYCASCISSANISIPVMCELRDKYLEEEYMVAVFLLDLIVLLLECFAGLALPACLL